MLAVGAEFAGVMSQIRYDLYILIYSEFSSLLAIKVLTHMTWPHNFADSTQGALFQFIGECDLKFVWYISSLSRVTTLLAARSRMVALGV